MSQRRAAPKLLLRTVALRRLIDSNDIVAPPSAGRGGRRIGSHPGCQDSLSTTAVIVGRKCRQAQVVKDILNMVPYPVVARAAPVQADN